jgi:adapter protein MecA 1/2
MKIEKINDNQIRCTLGKKDLADRNLKVSELAYGSEKARELFRDMMQQASYEVGFEAEDIPLMIEAIPVNADCIVLIVTKVDEPEELDTRFSRFSSEYTDDFDFIDDEYMNDYGDMEEIDGASATPSATDELDGDTAEEINSDISDVDIPPKDVANDVMDLFNKVKEFLNSSVDDASGSNFVSLRDSLAGMPSIDTSGTDTSDSGSVLKTSRPVRMLRVFSFADFDTFAGAAHAVSTVYGDKNSLYLDDHSERFYLTLSREKTCSENYNKTCNILAEYGRKEPLNASSVCYFDEHYRCIIRDHAIQAASKYAGN